MHGLGLEGAQNEEVERALEKIEAGGLFHDVGHLQ
jgi:hypothetical protein